MNNLYRFIASVALLSSVAVAQDATAKHPEGPRYVMPHGNGALPLTISEDWLPQGLSVLDNGTRFVIQLNNKKLNITFVKSLPRDEVQSQ